VWDLRCQTAQLIDSSLDLAVHLRALRSVQFQRGAHQTAIGPPHRRHHNLQIPTQFFHPRQGWSGLRLALRFQK
jgi:hypothetical protein